MLCKPGWLRPRAWLAQVRVHVPGRVRPRSAGVASPSPSASHDGASTPVRGEKKGVVMVEGSEAAAKRLERDTNVILVASTPESKAEARPAPQPGIGIMSGVETAEAPPQGDEIPVDAGVVNALPKGAVVVSCTRHGFSPFAKTGKLVVRLPSTSDSDPGSLVTYFIKVVMPPHASPRLIIEAEFSSNKQFHALMPDIIPEPVAMGKYASMEAYFLITGFVELTTLTLETTSDGLMWRFMDRLFELHRRSGNPGGKFGKPASLDGNGEGLAWNGAQPVEVPSSDTWEECYANLFRAKVELDVLASGPWEEYERAAAHILTQVIPRLLAPDHLREHDGGELIPMLIHGDLHDQNTGIVRRRRPGSEAVASDNDDDEGELIMFDASAFYAHNEMELGSWVPKYNIVTRNWVGPYASRYKLAQPAHEFEDRLRLYSLMQMLNYCAGHPGTTMRKDVYVTMLYLIEKYAPGLEGVAKYDATSDYYVTGEVHRIHTECGG